MLLSLLPNMHEQEKVHDLYCRMKIQIQLFLARHAKKPLLVAVSPLLDDEVRNLCFLDAGGCIKSNMIFASASVYVCIYQANKGVTFHHLFISPSTWPAYSDNTCAC